MFARFLKIFSMTLMLMMTLACHKDKKEDDTKSMSGTLIYDFPNYVVVRQRIHAVMSGLTSPDNIEYMWVSGDLNISDNDTVLGKSITVVIPDSAGNYMLTGYAKAEGYYTMSKSTSIKAISPSDTSVSGIVPGDEIFTDARDGAEYYVREIGNLKWFTQNLHYAGDTADADPELRDTLGCAYQNSDEIGKIFGRLYSWNEATGGTAGSGLGGGPQGACPEGWSVPTKEDWEDLGKAAGGGEAVEFYGSWKGLGSKLSVNVKLNDEPMWPYSPDNLHENMFGWNGIPVGNSKEGNRSFENISQYGMWWTSAEADDGTKGCYRYIYYNSSAFNVHKAGKDDYGMSVRCVKLIDKQ